MNELLRTPGFTGKDVFNAASALKLSDQVGCEINVTDLYVAEKPDKDGVSVISACLKDETGTIYATISQSIIGQVYGLVELLPCTVTVITKKSINEDREYYMLELI